jgi:hypothetical protein
MRAPQRYLVVIALLMVLILILLFNGTGARARFTPAAAAPAATPPCDTHTTVMTLTASNLAPNLGDTILLTSTLANEGCSDVGLPQYRLSMQSDPALPVLAPNPPEPVTHYLGIPPGGSDSAEFALQVIGSGQVVVTASSSFEVHLGYPGPAYWAGDTSQPLTITVPTTDTEVLVLQQAAYAIGCLPDVVIDDATYHFDCEVAAGQTVKGRVERFADESTALAAFEEARGTLPLQSFRCYLAYAWAQEQGAAPLRQEGHSWVAGRWLVTTRALDDTGVPVSPAPVAVSEAIYSAAIVNQLLQACDTAHLPLVLGTHE